MTRLTDGILLAIRELTGLAEAGAFDDTFGCSYEAADPEQRKAWENIPKADAWAKALLDKRRITRERRAAAATTRKNLESK